MTARGKAFLVGVVLALVAGLACVPEYDQVDGQTRVDVLVRSAYRSYANNPVAWDERHRGEQVEIWGKVALITPDGTVRIVKGGFFPPAYQPHYAGCQFDDLADVAVLGYGDAVIISARVDRPEGTNLRLTNCKLVAHQPRE